jgi:hypothetical protein
MLMRGCDLRRGSHPAETATVESRTKSQTVLNLWEYGLMVRSYDDRVGVRLVETGMRCVVES